MRASKHALLDELFGIGVSSRPLFVVGLLVPPSLTDDPNTAVGVDLLEVHELLTVSVPGVGPCRVDITWDPPLGDAGLAGTLEWDAVSDMALAVGEPVAFYAPDPRKLREEKQALRTPPSPVRPRTKRLRTCRDLGSGRTTTSTGSCEAFGHDSAGALT